MKTQSRVVKQLWMELNGNEVESLLRSIGFLIQDNRGTKELDALYEALKELEER